jgi:hypothetical protein
MDGSEPGASMAMAELDVPKSMAQCMGHGPAMTAADSWKGARF